MLPRARTDTGAGTIRPRVVIDCRWLGYGGAGRLTQLALDQLLRDHPGEWTPILWGSPAKLAAYSAVGTIVEWDGFPGRMYGQSGLASIPPARVAVFFHQVRPLTRRTSVSFILDTIPVRFGGSLASRLLKRTFLTEVARSSRHVLTISEFARRAIVRDLGCPAEKVTVTRIPIDGVRFDALAERRRATHVRPWALYVGRFAPHKNLPRLVLGFQASEFARSGGQLLLVGGNDSEIAYLRQRFEDPTGQVNLLGPCSESELDEYLATSRLLVMPSLEEGFGLPPFEAAAIGLPAVVSRTGAMDELPPTIAAFCDPLDTNSIASAIDQAAALRGAAPIYRRSGTLAADIDAAVRSALREA